jgi:uncharacterized GH25 family protein
MVSFFVGGASSVQAHYHILLPDKTSVKKGEKVTITYYYGHPFEHELFDASKPQRALAITPDGKQIDLLKSLDRLDNADGQKKVTAYFLSYTPQERGDHLVVVESAPHSIDGKKAAIIDTVKVVIHVETQKSWQQSAKLDADSFEIQPLTRPYGIRSGMVFRAAVENARDRGPVKDVLVEIERYNPTPPKELPPDEHITYAVRTDAAGVAASTLPEPGWWCITAVGEKHRCTLWVYVDGKLPTKPNE